MAFSRNALEQLLLANVLEIIWVRRNPVGSNSGVRRAMATNSRLLLDSKLGANILHYKRPTGYKPYEPSQYNLVTYWDMFKQEYRNAACEDLKVITAIPVRNKEEVDDWWNYFNQTLALMTPEQKQVFIDN